MPATTHYNPIHRQSGVEQRFNMRRADFQDDGFQNKRAKLDTGSERSRYAENSAKLISDWDQDDMDSALEEICIIAELSQQVTRPSNAPSPAKASQTNLDAENQQIKETLKTKEGEIGILRAQLQQNQIAKQSDATKHLRYVEQLEQKNKFNLSAAAKQIEKLKGELEFKDLEVKGLREKCKQLEVKSSSTIFVQPQNPGEKSMYNLSQIARKHGQPSEKVQEKVSKKVKEKEAPKSEGELLAKLLDHSFFREKKEPSVFTVYPSTLYRDPFDSSKEDKYRWIGLPKFESYLPKLNAAVMELIRSNTFPDSALEEIHRVVLEVLRNLEKFLDFLTTFPKNAEYDKALFESTDPGRVWNVEMLLSDELIHKNERGIEGRRALGLLCVICKASPKAVDILASHQLLTLLGTVNELVGKCRRPLEFGSLCVGSLYFSQLILSSRRPGEIDEVQMELLRKIIGAVIVSRSKLDMLIEVVNTLRAGAHHRTLAASMCRMGPPRSCALYMDARLQKAIFFTNDVCPLKMLQIQVKNLSFLCESKQHFMDMFYAFAGWLHEMLASSRKPQLWLFPEKQICCDVLECFCYLLWLCIPKMRLEADYREAFETGIVTLTNCCKGHRKKFKLSTVKLLSSTLRSSGLLDTLTPKGRLRAMHIMNEYEKDPTVTQNFTIGPNFSNNLTTVTNAS